MFMRYLPDGLQMKGADSHTINEIGIPSIVLMERAALKTVEVMQEEKLELSDALVVCGSGNNGGDGFAVARLLAENGKKAEVFFVGKETSLSEECKLQKQIVEKMGIPVRTDFPEHEYTVIIDAIFGVGLSREVGGTYADVIRWMNQKQAAKVAVDIPSGVSAQTGRILGVAFRADLTVSMACAKLGCELYPGKEYAGTVRPVQIGISEAFFDEDSSVFLTCDPEDLLRMMPERRPDSHKGDYGKVLMITGSKGMAGAAYLSARAAYAAGAGLVRIYTDESNRMILQQLLPEAVITTYREFDEKQLTQLLQWADVVCIGCGLGQSELSERILTFTLSSTDVPCIVDADGLNIVSRHMELLEKMKAPAVLTPHMMEMSRLTGHSVKELKSGRVEILRKFVEKYPVTCVLKDSRTAVMKNGLHPFLNLAGNSAMAKAGSGDVLAGVITGLKAQGLDEYKSAVLGVYLHACGGDRARDKKGIYSVLAQDLIAGIETCLCNSEEN